MERPKMYEDWHWHAYCGEEDWQVHNEAEALVATGMTKEVANLVAKLPDILRSIDSITKEVN